METEKPNSLYVHTSLVVLWKFGNGYTRSFQWEALMEILKVKRLSSGQSVEDQLSYKSGRGFPEITQDVELVKSRDTVHTFSGKVQQWCVPEFTEDCPTYESGDDLKDLDYFLGPFNSK